MQFKSVCLQSSNAKRPLSKNQGTASWLTTSSSRKRDGNQYRLGNATGTTHTHTHTCMHPKIIETWHKESDFFGNPGNPGSHWPCVAAQCSHSSWTLQFNRCFRFASIREKHPEDSTLGIKCLCPEVATSLPLTGPNLTSKGREMQFST